MKNVAVLLANGFEEIEAITVIDVLRRANVNVSTIALTGKEAEGAHGVKIVADQNWDSVLGSDWDMVVLPGGQPGADTLKGNSQVHELIQKQMKSGREVAAICAAPIALEAAGVLKGKKVTCYPGFENQLSSAKVENSTVITDGNITTSRGPATAMEFALSLVEKLQGSDAKIKVGKDLLFLEK